jgi:hypothetical protein
MTCAELELERDRWKLLATRANMYLDALGSDKIGPDILKEYEAEWSRAREFTHPLRPD